MSQNTALIDSPIYKKHTCEPDMSPIRPSDTFLSLSVCLSVEEKYAGQSVTQQGEVALI